MKKLMLTTAAAVLTMGAFALCGDVEVVQAVIVKAPSRTVYKFKWSGKTTKGVEAKVKASACGDGVMCGDGQAECNVCIPRYPAKLKIKGWVALCDNKCNTINNGSGDAEDYAFWATKPYKANITPDAELSFVDGEFPHVIGKKPNKAEAFGTFKGTLIFAEGVAEWSLGDGLYFAGLGKYKAPVYKKIKGKFAGSPAASWYISNKQCAQTTVWDCETLKLKCDENPNTVAFGKWSMKYSKSASKKLSKGKLPKTPSYATRKSDAEAVE